MLREIIAIAFTFSIAGWLLAMAVVPKSVGYTSRLFLSLSLSVPAVVLIALPGILFQRINEPTIILGIALLFAVAVARFGYQVRRDTGHLSFHYDRLSIGVRTWSYTIPQLLLMGAAAWIGIVGPEIASRGPNGLFRGGSTWYYWGLVRGVISAGKIPWSIPEWGANRPFPTEYLVHTLHGSVTGILAGQFSVQTVEIYHIAFIVLILIAAYALWKIWLPDWWALLAALITLSGSRLESKLIDYKPETFGLYLTLWSAWLLSQAVERRSKRWAVICGVVSASAFLSHAEIWLLTIPLWSGILLGRFVSLLPPFAPGQPSHSPAGKPSTDFGAKVRSLILPLVVGVMAFSITVIGMGFATGNTGRISRIVGLSKPTNKAVVAVASTKDETWLLNRAAHGIDARKPPPQLGSNLFMIRPTRQPYPHIDLANKWTLASLAVIALVLVLTGWRNRTLRDGMVCWTVFVVGIYAVSEVIGIAYHTYVPGRAGPLRIMPYYALSIAGILASFGWLVTHAAQMLWNRLSAKHIRGDLSSRVLRHVAAAVVSVLLLIAFTPAAQGEANGGGITVYPGSYRAYTWISRNLPVNAVILTNGYPAGTLWPLSQRVGWVDGRMPYLESSAWKEDAIHKLITARKFFQHPYKNRDKLSSKVDYILVVKPGESLGGFRFQTNYRQLAKSPNLKPVYTSEKGKIVIYKVIKSAR